MMADYDSPMHATKKLTEFLDTLECDEVKIQILEIYLEDNKNILNGLIEVLKLDNIID